MDWGPQHLVYISGSLTHSHNQNECCQDYPDLEKNTKVLTVKNSTNIFTSQF